MISNLEKNPAKMDEAITKLAYHIIRETKVEMNNMHRARYSYISTKIAKQRATKNKEKKLYEDAEIARADLRKRQELFQRELTRAR